MTKHFILLSCIFSLVAGCGQNSTKNKGSVSSVQNDCDNYETVKITDTSEVSSLAGLLKALGGSIAIPEIAMLTCDLKKGSCSISINKNHDSEINCSERNSGKCNYSKEGKHYFRISSEINVNPSFRYKNFIYNHKLVTALKKLSKKFPNIINEYISEVEGVEVNYISLSLSQSKIWCGSYVMPYSNRGDLSRNKCYFRVEP